MGKKLQAHGQGVRVAGEQSRESRTCLYSDYIGVLVDLDFFLKKLYIIISN